MAKTSTTGGSPAADTAGGRLADNLEAGLRGPARIPVAEPVAGPGQAVVVSPTGDHHVVDETAVDLLNLQGYTTDTKAKKAAPPPAATEQPVDDGRPDAKAGKQDWVAYAISKGAASYDAANKTKDELVREYGG